MEIIDFKPKYREENITQCNIFDDKNILINDNEKPDKDESNSSGFSSESDENDSSGDSSEEMPEINENYFWSLINIIEWKNIDELPGKTNAIDNIRAFADIYSGDGSFGNIFRQKINAITSNKVFSRICDKYPGCDPNTVAAHIVLLGRHTYLSSVISPESVEIIVSEKLFDIEGVKEFMNLI